MQLARIVAAACLVGAFGAQEAMAGSAGRCGGTGGNHSKTLTCPDGQYIAALGARGGLFVDQFSVACRKIPVSGNSGELGGYKSAGPGGGTRSFSDECDNGHAVRIIDFKSGAVVDKVVSGSCMRRSGSGWTRQTDSTASVQIGGGGGISCSITCPSNEAMYKVTVKYGGVVDSIRGECRK